jgi:hypothetical protein
MLIYQISEDDCFLAGRFITAWEADLGYRLTPGQCRDLLKDNFPWPSDKCDRVVELIDPDGRFAPCSN